jgi:hypothetical protein
LLAPVGIASTAQLTDEDTAQLTDEDTAQLTDEGSARAGSLRRAGFGGSLWRAGFGGSLWRAGFGRCAQLTDEDIARAA